MDYNLLNGGLVKKVACGLVISDLKKYTTRFDSREYGMFWFMNADEDYVFYSNQMQGNALFRMDFVRKNEELLINKPVYGLYLYSDWIYYINETNEKIYKCEKDGSSESVVVDEKAGCFIIAGDRILYTTPQGIRSCSLEGKQKEKIHDSMATCLIQLGDRLVFTDKKSRYTLSMLDLKAGKLNVYEDIIPSSLNTDGHYLYVANRMNENSIYRMDPMNGNRIRICGANAQYIHIIENELYFCINREWNRMSLSGGKYLEIT